MGVEWELMGHRSDGIRGSLQAWDPVRQRRVWEVPLPVAWNPGTLTTAGGLVFQGRAGGEFVAYDAANGEELWRYPVGLGIAAPPITYSINGKQYVALLVGWGAAFAALGGEDAAKLGWSYGTHTRRLVTFSLEGKTDMPKLPPPAPAVPLEASFEVNHQLAETGADVFGQCMFCHGIDAISGGVAPDLRASPIVLSDEGFAEVLRKGVRRTRGMPSYENLSDQHLLALRHYIRGQADLARPGEEIVE
jgi:quinohemoprotein ethanol dehydrogenase